MAAAELSAGPIDYVDEGEGPAVVLLHGLLMDGGLFDQVVVDLRKDHRCVVPTLPVGSHLRPMCPDADLSLHGLGQIVAELLERLDLRDVTLVQNDLAVAQVVATERPDRLAPSCSPRAKPSTTTRPACRVRTWRSPRAFPARSTPRCS